MSQNLNLNLFLSIQLTSNRPLQSLKKEMYFKIQWLWYIFECSFETWDKKANQIWIIELMSKEVSFVSCKKLLLSDCKIKLFLLYQVYSLGLLSMEYFSLKTNIRQPKICCALEFNYAGYFQNIHYFNNLNVSKEGNCESFKGHN